MVNTCSETNNLMQHSQLRGKIIFCLDDKN